MVGWAYLNQTSMTTKKNRGSSHTDAELDAALDRRFEYGDE